MPNLINLKMKLFDLKRILKFKTILTIFESKKKSMGRMRISYVRDGIDIVRTFMINSNMSVDDVNHIRDKFVLDENIGELDYTVSVIRNGEEHINEYRH